MQIEIPGLGYSKPDLHNPGLARILIPVVTFQRGNSIMSIIIISNYTKHKLWKNIFIQETYTSVFNPGSTQASTLIPQFKCLL